VEIAEIHMAIMAMRKEVAAAADFEKDGAHRRPMNIQAGLSGDNLTFPSSSYYFDTQLYIYMFENVVGHRNKICTMYVLVRSLNSSP